METNLTSDKEGYFVMSKAKRSNLALWHTHMIPWVRRLTWDDQEFEVMYAHNKELYNSHVTVNFKSKFKRTGK